MPTVEVARERRWPTCAGTPPYFWANWRDGAVTARGDDVAQLGHRYAGRDGGARGVYASWAWDGEALTAEVDALGYFNLFVYAKGSTVGVSPSILQLIAAGADPTLDERALAVFFRLGLLLHEDTPFAHIRVLPPGGKLRWTEEGLELSGGPPIAQERSITRDAAVDAFISLTRQSVSDVLHAWPGDVLLPLSGGRDSRHLLLEMDHLGRPPRACVTFHHEGSRLNAEAQAARAICERLGQRHIVLAQPRVLSQDILRTLILTSFCSDEHAQMMPLHDFFMDKPVAALDGIAGDILSNPDDWAEDFYRRAARGDFRGIARRMMEGHAGVVSRPGCSGGAGPIYSKGRDEEAVEYVADAIAEFADAPDPYQSFWFWHRTRREIGFVPTSMLASAQAVFCPYLDPELVELGLSLPYRITRDQKLHDDALARAYPLARDVPFHESFANPPPQRRRLQQRIRTALDRLTTLLAVESDRNLHTILRGTGRLRHPSSEIYRLYTRCLQQIDAQKAQRLLTLAGKLETGRALDLITEDVPSPVHSNTTREAA